LNIQTAGWLLLDLKQSSIKRPADFKLKYSRSHDGAILAARQTATLSRNRSHLFRTALGNQSINQAAYESCPYAYARPELAVCLSGSLARWLAGWLATRRCESG
jgi:hypothetical protein